MIRRFLRDVAVSTIAITFVIGPGLQRQKRERLDVARAAMNTNSALSTEYNLQAERAEADGDRVAASIHRTTARRHAESAATFARMVM